MIPEMSMRPFGKLAKKFCADGSKVTQVVSALFIVLPIFSYGTAVGWLSPMGPVLMSEHSPSSRPIPKSVLSWMASVPYLVGMVCVFIYGFVADTFGRKKALLLTSFSMAMSWSIKLYSAEPWALITARAVMGVSLSGCYVITPLYIKEMSEDSIRGMLGTLVVLSQNLGNLLMYIAGEYLTYYPVLYIMLAVPLVHFFIFLTMPETPSFLMKKGRMKEAREVMAWLRCRGLNDEAVETEMKKLLHEMEKTESKKFKEALKSIVKDKATSRAFRIVMIITVGRELCGCLAILHFASTIFKEATGETYFLTPNQQAAVLGAIQIMGSCTASSLVEKTGRKVLLATTCLVSGISMGALGTWFYFNSLNEGPPMLSWIPILALCLCIFCDAAGLQPVPFVIMTEMFSFRLRGTVTSLVIAFACILVSVELLVFQSLVSTFGMHTVFWGFATVCLLSTIYVILVVPETRQKSLDEIYEKLRGNKITPVPEDMESPNY